MDKARDISVAAARRGTEVRLLLRVVAEGDFSHPGQAGGLRLESLLPAAEAISALPNVRIWGVTSFPCLQLDKATQTLKPTPNLHTILRAAQLLEGELGLQIEQINAPENTCVGAMQLLAGMGATHGEPGHALTGTTYLHAHGNQPERPAMVYVSEVSHVYGHQAYAYGGGTYRRARINNALVGTQAGQLVRTTINPLDPTAIDYYVALAVPQDGTIAVGDTVILASRAQVFTSRSYVAIVTGIDAGAPSLLGLFDALGNAVKGTA